MLGDASAMEKEAVAEATAIRIATAAEQRSSSSAVDRCPEDRHTGIEMSADSESGEIRSDGRSLR